MRKIFGVLSLMAMFFTGVCAWGAEEKNLPPGRQKIYFTFGAPAAFSYYNPHSFDFFFGSNGFIDDGATIPDGIWSGGLLTGFGFEQPLTPQTSAFAEAEMLSMDVNRVLASNIGATKTAATFYNLILGLKENVMVGNPVSPYVNFGVGATYMQIQDIYTMVLGMLLEKQEYKGWRLIYKAGLGLDYRCFGDMLAFTEIQMYSADAEHVFSQGTYITATILKGGVRLEL